MSLRAYCTMAIAVLAATPVDDRVRAFMALRYDEMRLAHPHPTFTVDQATLDFFDVTLGYIDNPESIPKVKPDTSEYARNYLGWVRANLT